MNNLDKWGIRILITFMSFCVAAFLSMFLVLTVGIVSNSGGALMPLGYQIAFYSIWTIAGTSGAILANREIENNR